MVEPLLALVFANSGNVKVLAVLVETVAGVLLPNSVLLSLNSDDIDEVEVILALEVVDKALMEDTPTVWLSCSCIVVPDEVVLSKDKELDLSVFSVVSF